MPIDKKRTLQAMNGISIDFDKRVAPRAKFVAFHVAVGNVQTANKTHHSVNNNNFPVVALIDFSRKK